MSVRISDHDLLRRVSDLDPTSFENLTLDLLRSVGFKNLVWRTPGADGGRDIQGEHTFVDLSGFNTRTKWYIECKRYSSSIDWPTLWKKIAYADSHNADYLLLVTNSQPSPQCESEIQKWNSDRKRPIIRVWQGYQLPSRLRLSEDVAVAHGLLEASTSNTSHAVEFASTISKLTQAAHAALIFDTEIEKPLTAAAALAELFDHRLQSLKTHGHFLSGATLRSLDDWSWLGIDGDFSTQEEVGFRSIISILRHVTQCQDINCEINGNEVIASIRHNKRNFDVAAEKFIKPVLIWSLCDEFQHTDEFNLNFSLRGRHGR